MMQISDPHDRFFYPHHTPIKDTYNITLAVCYSYLGWHLECVQTYSASSVNVWVVDWSDKLHFRWLKRVPMSIQKIGIMFIVISWNISF